MVETTNGNLPAELSIYTSVAEFPTPNKTPATSPEWIVKASGLLETVL
jgi:hypothetical protein